METCSRSSERPRTKKVRRGNGKSHYKNNVIIVGNNCAGIKNKTDSLFNLVETLHPGILFLQESKLYSKGQVKIPNFYIFETNRVQNGGGGLITAVHEKFSPALIEAENENPDLLIVQVKMSDKNVRLINGYGPQESETICEKMKFFTAFESAIISAKLNGNLICAELDANSKIGMENISLDPNHISANGRILMEIVVRNGLIVVNSTGKCFGTITRIRKTTHSEEKSVIDYFVVCHEFFELICSLLIDEERKYVLTKYSSRMGVKCIKKSDHNVLVCSLNIKWDNRIRKERKEVFKLKDVEGLRSFSEKTSNCSKLVQLSQHSTDFLDDADKWMKTIENIKHQSFKKIRITGKSKPQNPELNSIMKYKQDLISKLGETDNPVQKYQLGENIRSIDEEI